MSTLKADGKIGSTIIIEPIFPFACFVDNTPDYKYLVCCKYKLQVPDIDVQI